MGIRHGYMLIVYLEERAHRCILSTINNTIRESAPSHSLCISDSFCYIKVWLCSSISLVYSVVKVASDIV